MFGPNCPGGWLSIQTVDTGDRIQFRKERRGHASSQKSQAAAPQKGVVFPAMYSMELCSESEPEDKGPEASVEEAEEAKPAVGGIMCLCSIGRCLIGWTCVI